jgi:hypothetical protein
MNGSDYDDRDADEQFKCKGIYDCVPQKRKLTGDANRCQETRQTIRRKRQNAQDSQDKLMS